jgi:hypothetical protein
LVSTLLKKRFLKNLPIIKKSSIIFKKLFPFLDNPDSLYSQRSFTTPNPIQPSHYLPCHQANDSAYYSNISHNESASSGTDHQMLYTSMISPTDEYYSHMAERYQSMQISGSVETAMNVGTVGMGQGEFSEKLGVLGCSF